jgi:hypothetical protein
MLEKLKKNFGLSNWLARGAFVLAYAFAMWRVSQSVLAVYGEQLSVTPTIWTALLFSLLSGVISLLITHFFTGLILNLLRFFFLPRQEFTLLVILFFALKNLILGALNCFYFISPIVMAWGKIVFPVVSFLISGILFYATVNKYYLNNKTAPIFYKTLAVFFCVLSVLTVIENIAAYGV